MKFKVHRRAGQFGKINIRNENHGDEKVPAADLSVTFTGGKRELDMLCPMPDGSKFSEMIYDESGNLLMPFLSPMKVHRKPDTIKFCCWDRPTSEKDFLQFGDVSVKSISVQLKDKRNIIVSCMVQLHDDPEKHTARLRRLMDAEREFSLEALQEDLFNEEQDEDEEKDQSEMDIDTEQEPDEDDDE